MHVWARAIVADPPLPGAEAAVVLDQLHALGARWAPVFNKVAEAGVQAAGLFVQGGLTSTFGGVAAVLGAVSPFVTESLLFELESAKDAAAVATFQDLLVTVLLAPLAKQLPDSGPWPWQAAAVVAAARRLSACMCAV
jgi:hypothetical protein